jgi:hypothetical protein
VEFICRGVTSESIGCRSHKARRFVEFICRGVTSESSKRSDLNDVRSHCNLCKFEILEIKEKTTFVYCDLGSFISKKLFCIF